MKQHLEEKIRARAYEIWEREGRPHGREQEHWQEAARQLGAPEMPHHENFVSGVEDEEPPAAAAAQSESPAAAEEAGSVPPAAAAKARAPRAKASAKPRATKGPAPKA